VKRRVLLLGLVVLLAAPATARAGGPSLVLGATEDDVRQPSLVAAKANMDLLRDAGFTAVRVSQVWAPGQTSLSATELAPLQNAVQAAALDGIDVYLTVTQFGSATTPLTDEAQQQFAQFAAWLAKTLPGVHHVIVGNEPNLNRFWLPQFDSSGSDAAAPAYERLLALTYDALKAVDPKLEVLGGAVSPRGSDKPNGIRPTHSPTVFIRDLGAAYRASGRTTPIMDSFAFHPYEDNSSISPVTGVHPKTTTIAIADYSKLVALLGQAFDGTAQAGSTLPIVYDEFGVETQVPPAKASFYTGVEPSTIHPVDAATQAVYYRQAIQLAFCQPNVKAMLVFHSVDEVNLNRWQSGLYYADGTAKASLAPTRAAMQESRRGVIADCAGKIQVTPTAKIRANKLRPVLRCNIDCRYVARLVRMPGTPVRKARGVAVGGTPKTIAFSRRGVMPGRYQVRVSVVAAENPGPPVLRRTAVFRLP
jgi:hypothetical protein